MDQGADGRRAFHRVRQPDVQRELRGLAHRAAENQQAGNAWQWCPSAAGLAARACWSVPKFSEPSAAPDHQDAEQESEVAEAIGDEGFFRRVRRRWVFQTRTR